jgi:hypothetical protein
MKPRMSACGTKADITNVQRHVRFGGKADIRYIEISAYDSR